MLFIMRAGLQILADHPRLYWGRDCKPGTEWFQFQVPVPTGRVWTAKDDSVTLPTWLGSRPPPYARAVALVAFRRQPVVADQRRGVLCATIFHRSVAPVGAAGLGSLPGQVMHGDPVCLAELSGRPQLDRYNGLQQLSYFITVFVAAPVSIATGLMQSPAISNALGWFGRLFNRQAMRSVHFISFAWFVGFILAHGVMVFVTGIRQNTNHMFGGVDNARPGPGFQILSIGLRVWRSALR